MNDDDLNDAPEGLLPGYQQNDREAFEQLIKGIRYRSAGAFFYPHCGCDWMPLYRLSHMAELFVFVDWTVTESDWEEKFARIINKQTFVGDGLAHFQLANSGLVFRKLETAIGPLASNENLPWLLAGNDQATPSTWGRLVRLQRNVGKPRRIIWLLFIHGSPLELYRRLFLQRQITPKAIFLHEHWAFQEGANEAQAEAWQNFAAYGSQLSTLIEQNGGELPEFLVTDALATNWPHQFRWLDVRNFGGPVMVRIATRPKFHWPMVQTNSEPGSRRLVVTRRPLNPHVAKNIDAVVLPYREHDQYCWPDNVTVIVGSEPEHGDLPVQEGPRRVVCPIAGLPLLKALERLERVCSERGLTKVASQCFGFEDEAPALGTWRKQPGQVKELMLHVEDDGSFVGLGSAADETD